jgi:hypothetical protein
LKTTIGSRKYPYDIHTGWNDDDDVDDEDDEEEGKERGKIAMAWVERDTSRILSESCVYFNPIILNS